MMKRCKTILLGTVTPAVVETQPRSHPPVIQTRTHPKRPCGKAIGWCGWPIPSDHLRLPRRTASLNHPQRRRRRRRPTIRKDIIIIVDKIRICWRSIPTRWVGIARPVRTIILVHHQLVPWSHRPYRHLSRGPMHHPMYQPFLERVVSTKTVH